MDICGKLQFLPPEAFAGEQDTGNPEGSFFGSNLHVSADIISRKEQMEEFMFLGLRMNEGIKRAAFEKNFGVPIEAVYLEVLEKLKHQELIEMREGRIALTDRGMDLGNYVMAKFLF